MAKRTKGRASSWAPSSHLLGASPAAAGAAQVRPRRFRSIILSVCVFILVTECCERVAYYGLTGSLPIYFHKELGLGKDFSTELSSLFSSFNYITPLAGAYLADAMWGRFKTILVFSIVYVMGMCTCVVSAYPSFLTNDVSMVRIMFLLGLFETASLKVSG